MSFFLSGIFFASAVWEPHEKRNLFLREKNQIKAQAVTTFESMELSATNSTIMAKSFHLGDPKRRYV